MGGQPREIKPHPSFRLILAVDPRHGEVGNEICLGLVKAKTSGGEVQGSEGGGWERGTRGAYG